MKEFLKKYSYSCMKMFLNQFAIAIFGMVLALAAGMAENDTLQIFCSVGAVLFYMFLLYAMTFEIGSKDKISVDYGHIPYRPLTGLYMSLVANSLNILLAILVTVGFLFADGSTISNIGGSASVAALFLEGMYTGLLTIQVGGQPLNAMAWPYFAIIVPSLLTCTLAYFFGLKDIRFTRIFLARTPEELEKMREKKQKK